MENLANHKRNIPPNVKGTIIPKQPQQFSPFLQGPPTNTLAQITTRSIKPVINAITGQGTISKDGLSIFFEIYKDFRRSLRVSTHKLLDVCILELTRQNDYKGTKTLNPVVNIDIDDYMEKCGIPLTKPSRDKTRRVIAEDLETLYNASLDWTEREEGNKKGKSFAKMRIIAAQILGRRNAVVSFSQHLAQYLTHDAYLMQYPLALLKVDNRNEAAYMLGYKLALHNSIDNNNAKGTADIISIKALLEACPAIPTYEEIAKNEKDHHVESRIIKPFEKALDSLVEVGLLSQWEYCNAKHKPLTEAQLKSMDYQTFIKYFLHFDLLNAPDQTRRMKENQKKLTQRKRIAKSRADKE